MFFKYLCIKASEKLHEIKHEKQIKKVRNVLGRLQIKCMNPSCIWKMSARRCGNELQWKSSYKFICSWRKVVVLRRQSICEMG